MSIRESLQQSLGNVLHVASTKGAQHATKQANYAIHPATGNATTGLQANKYAGLDATDSATTTQHTPATDATPPQQTELTRLVRRCGGAYQFTEAEHAEALAAAQQSPEAALESFRLTHARLLAAGEVTA